ncbi:glycine C-acetyltransferase [Confluentibacter sediminis]|uniref:glycine C-acetyltransferase n=1 Tax=Confluentibacter sediminis TaxID=2219045 RepID=UPI000DAEC4C5|nr:glycine C-acetyltransferase [Confluentibacter sediminis]
MYGTIKKALQTELKEITDKGLYKKERVITSRQGAEINTNSQKGLLNFCANNYLGLAAHEDVIAAGIEALQTHGFGLSSVRFICGTQDIHKVLEEKTAEFLGMEDCILYAAAFDANGGLFEPLFSDMDVIISDELNHASIIDGIRLSKAKRLRYKHNNMVDLETQLKETASSRRRIIVTDGSFSMDGTIAQMDKICDLADTYDALVMMDECHSTGFMGATGRGVHEYHQVMDRVDIITGTYGKALGGASGGFTAGRKEIIDLLRQRSRPYLFSNTLAPAIVGASIKVLDIISKSTYLRDKLETNTAYFRSEMTTAGFDIVPGTHPIVPIMLYEAQIAQDFSARLLEEGIYVIGFFYPVVPHGKARIRVQLSAAHELDHIKTAIKAFIKVGKELRVI